MSRGQLEKLTKEELIDTAIYFQAALDEIQQGLGYDIEHIGLEPHEGNLRSIVFLKEIIASFKRHARAALEGKA